MKKIGPYEIKEELGRGGMGITYKAIDTNLSRVVALKVMNEEFLSSREMVRRFVTEATAAARIEHRNVATVFFKDEHNGIHYYAMEFCEGETLQKLVDKRGPIAWRRALRYAYEITEGLRTAHLEDVIHRDIKPLNIMLASAGGDEVVKIIDFGIAKVDVHCGKAETSFRTQGFIGSAAYASPEQIDPKRLEETINPSDSAEIDRRTDFYSLGCTLWFMLTGKQPFQGDYTEVVMKQLNSPPPFSQLKGIPDPVRRLLIRMLEKDRRKRPETADILMTEIERCLHPEESKREDKRPRTWVIVATVITSIAFVAICLRLRQTPVESVASGQAHLSTPASKLAVTPRPESGPIDLNGGNVGARRIFGGIPFRWCPPGKFMMGSPTSEARRDNDETAHLTKLNYGFWLAETELTQSQWHSVMGSTIQEKAASQLDKVIGGIGEEYPMCFVSWEDAVNWCDKKARQGKIQEGWRITLPTEAEWEYACRAGTTTSYHYGNSLNSSEADFDCATGPKRVGSYPENEWGLRDMHGNVWEWCLDYYASYPGGAITDPVGPSTGLNRVYRGGAWDKSVGKCRSAMRGCNAPTYSNSDLGFRPAIVRLLTPAPPAPIPAGERLQLEITPEALMVFRWCPPGTIELGHRGHGAHNLDDSNIAIFRRGFWMAETDVTQKQWTAVMNTSLLDQANKMLADEALYPKEDAHESYRELSASKFPSKGEGEKIIGPQDDQTVMYYVNWDEANDFCRKAGIILISRSLQFKMRLPSEGQWEYACRAGTRTRTYVGDVLIQGERNAPDLDTIAWYGGNSSIGYRGRGWDTSSWREKQYPGGLAGPRRVGTKEANGWQLFDMLGNVWQWCRNSNGDNGGRPVICGGSWRSKAWQCNASYGTGLDAGVRDFDVGFRPILEPSD